MLPLEGQGVLLQLAQRNGGARGERSACCEGHNHTQGGREVRGRARAKSRKETGLRLKQSQNHRLKIRNKLKI